MSRPSRRPPDRYRGPARRLDGPARSLADRLGHVDRRTRFQERLAEVERVRARHDATMRRVAIAAWGGATVLLTTIGAALFGGAGLLIGIGVAAVVFVLVRAAAWTANRRGAAAWDWQAGRYRLYGAPAQRVQMMDRPPDARATEDPMGTGFDGLFRRRS